jgi:hypothetical protein
MSHGGGGSDPDVFVESDLLKLQKKFPDVEFASGRTWTCAQESWSLCCKLCVSATV